MCKVVVCTHASIMGHASMGPAGDLLSNSIIDCSCCFYLLFSYLLLSCLCVRMLHYFLFLYKRSASFLYVINKILLLSKPGRSHFSICMSPDDAYLCRRSRLALLDWIAYITSSLTYYYLYSTPRIQALPALVIPPR